MEEEHDLPIRDAFELSGELYEEIKFLSILQGLTVQELIVKALEQYIRESVH